jgi:uncharacterized protein YuzE
MKIQYDNETDSIYVRFSDKAIIESEEKERGVIVDYDEKDEIVAIEILHVSTHPYDIDLPVILKIAS